MDITKRKKSKPTISRKELSIRSQYEEYPELSDQQILSLAVMTEMQDRRADTFLKKGAYWIVVIFLFILIVCTVVSGFLGNLTLAALFGSGSIGTAILGGLSGLFSKAFDNKDKPNLIESTQKLIEAKNKINNPPNDLLK